jgi:hypothetical protein
MGEKSKKKHKHKKKKTRDNAIYNKMEIETNETKG